MTAELLNLSLFAQMLAKSLWMTGLGPGIVLAALVATGLKFVGPVKVGKVYRIDGYYTGEFIGEVEAADRGKARVRVLDPMRPIPKVVNRCCFPECLREDFHGGEHEFASVREGALVEVSWALAKWAEVPERRSA
jgi:hypothetical protein